MAIPKQSKPARRVPRKTRRLTREEAAILGVSYSAKRRVSTSVKRVTPGTETFSDRQVATQKLRTRTRKRTITREAYAAIRIVRGRNGRTQYRDLSKAQLMRVLKANRGRNVNLSFKIRVKGRQLGSGSVANDGFGWRSASASIDAEELEHNLSQFLDNHGASGAIRYSVIV